MIELSWGEQASYSKLFADDPVLPLKDHLDTERAREGEKRHTRNAVHEAEIEIESDQ